MKKTGERLFAKLVICIQYRTNLKWECISIELKGSKYSIGVKTSITSPVSVYTKSFGEQFE